MVISLILAFSSSYSLLITMRDIDDLSSSFLADLGAIFWIGLQEQADPVLVITSLQSLVIDGPRREGRLKSETAVDPGLVYTLVVEVG